MKSIEQEYFWHARRDENEVGGLQKRDRSSCVSSMLPSRVWKRDQVWNVAKHWETTLKWGRGSVIFLPLDTIHTSRRSCQTRCNSTLGSNNLYMYHSIRKSSRFISMIEESLLLKFSRSGSSCRKCEHQKTNHLSRMVYDSFDFPFGHLRRIKVGRLLGSAWESRAREIPGIGHRSTADQRLAQVQEMLRQSAKWYPWLASRHLPPEKWEFLEEDSWLLLMSPTGQTAHQDLSPFSAKMFFLPRWFVINAHAVLSDTPFTGWGTATCFYSAASSPNRLEIINASAGPWCAHSRKTWWGRVREVTFFVNKFCSNAMTDTGGLLTDQQQTKA